MLSNSTPLAPAYSPSIGSAAAEPPPSSGNIMTTLDSGGIGAAAQSHQHPHSAMALNAAALSAAAMSAAAYPSMFGAAAGNAYGMAAAAFQPA